MVDPGRASALLERIARELEALRQLAQRDTDALAADDVALPAAKYRLIVAIEAAIDVAEHILASEGLRASTSYADAFAVLEEAGLIDAELATAMSDAARFRNLLVHGYADVDDERVVEILDRRLDDLDRFRRAIAEVVARDGEPA